MERDDTGAPENRLPQPAHAEQQQQDPDRELEGSQRDGIEKWAKDNDDKDQQHKTG